MAQQENQSCFFRTTTSDGCISHLPELCLPEDGWRSIYLKSGYGWAASRFIGEAARLAQARGETAQVYWDAPGRERRCALRLPERKICLLDAEYPFPLGTKLPGAGEELLSLDGCRDNAALRAKREQLLQLQEAWKRTLLRAGHFLRAARAMKKDMGFVAAETLDIPKVERYASRFAARRFPAPNGRVGTESRRFLTAVTGQGLLLRRSGLEGEYSQAVVLEDEYGVAGPRLWNLLRSYALGNGLNVISCPCTLFPQAEPEHLLLPELGFALITANRRHPIELAGAQHIQAGRFFQKEALQPHQCRLRFCRKTMRELLAEAYQAQAAAEQLRKELDELYYMAEYAGAVEAAVQTALGRGR